MSKPISRKKLLELLLPGLNYLYGLDSKKLYEDYQRKKYNNAKKPNAKKYNKRSIK
jgi:hypothetical protein